ncbi:MAG: hypothetical protein Aurels2KO_55930 [Aureliella sp.]
MCECCKKLEFAIEATAKRVIDRLLDSRAVVPNSICFTVEQAAIATGLTVKSLRLAISVGELPAKKRRGKWMIKREHLVRWLS